MSLKKKLENLEKEIKNLTSLINEENKVVIIYLLAPLHKSNKVIFENEDSCNVESQLEVEKEFTETEKEKRLTLNEKEALEWIRNNINLRKSQKVLVFVTPWEWLVFESGNLYHRINSYQK